MKRQYKAFALLCTSCFVFHVIAVYFSRWPASGVLMFFALVWFAGSIYGWVRFWKARKG